MLAVLQFVFSSFWIWLGFALLMTLALTMLSVVVDGAIIAVRASRR